MNKFIPVILATLLIAGCTTTTPADTGNSLTEELFINGNSFGEVQVTLSEVGYEHVDKTFYRADEFNENGQDSL